MTSTGRLRMERRLAKLAEEIALLTVDPGQGEGETPGNIGDLLAGDDPGTPLRAFAADLSTPAALAARAQAWHEHIHYGLWRIDDRAPGLRCIDIVSGTGRYVEFPTEATTGLPRWTVWLGGIVPVDGIWRSTGVGVRLSPTEADAAAESVDEAALAMLHALAGEPEAPPAPIPFGYAEPHGVYADDQEPVSAEMVSLMGKVAGAMITGIAADVHRYLATPPVIANTGGDPMCLISATIAVEEGTSGNLAARPDFDRDSDEPDRVTWWGALIPDGQRKAMMADAMAQLRAQGHQDVEAPDGPQRWGTGCAADPWPRDHHRGELSAAAHPPPRHTPQDRRQPSSYLGEADRPGNGLRLARRPADSSEWHGCRGRRLGEVLAR